MTDKDIIKALECCKSPVGSGGCNKCPLKDVRNKTLTEGEKSCTTIMLENALDLINLQQAKIERLQNENNENFDKWKMLADKTKDHYNDLYEEAKEILKSEAIKEFAERLIAVSHPYADTQMVFEIQIKNLVKEMVGDSNGK